MKQMKQMNPKRRKQILEKRLSIKGAITVNRRVSWVARYASTKDCVFSYKKKDQDKKDRYIVDLRQC